MAILSRKDGRHLDFLTRCASNSESRIRDRLSTRIDPRATQQQAQQQLKMWLPQVLLHWRALLFRNTSRLLVHAPKLVWDTKDALARIADAITRGILRGDLRKTMLETCNRWILDGAETAGHEQPLQPPELAEISAAFSPAISGTENAEPDPEAQHCSESPPAAPDANCELNASLVRQIKKLRDELHEARVNLFNAQRIVARLQEMETIRANRSHVRHNVYLRLSHLDPRLAPRADRRFGASTAASLFPNDYARFGSLYPVGEFSSSESESSSDDSETDSSYQDDHQEEFSDFGSQHSDASSVSRSDSESDDEVDPLPPSVGPRATSAAHVVTNAAAQSPSSGAPRTISYRQLTEIHPGEENDSWHRQALRQLRERRMQRQAAPEIVESRLVSLRNSLEEAPNEEQPQDPVSYETLASLRRTLPDDEIAEWQRQALRYLTEERRRIACQRASTSSTSPTNSSTSTLTFVYDD